MHSSISAHDAPSILIVDDTPAVLQVLSEMLKSLGYKVRTAPGGALGVQEALARPPDLVLLDIDMPGMNGYEVCTRLKADEKLRDVPVIFISSLSETMDKIKAFGAGGVDYVIKPFQAEEVEARINTHLKIRNLQRELLRHNQHLEEVVRERTRQLVEAHERLTILDHAKSEFLNLISHEMRTPLNGIFGVAELISMGDTENPAHKELWTMFNMARQAMQTILDDAVLLTSINVSISESSSEIIPLGVIIDAALKAVTPFAQARHIELPTSPLDGVNAQENVLGDKRLLVKAFSGLFRVAVKLSDTHPVRMTWEALPTTMRITIRAMDRVIPPEFLSSFFELFAVTKTFFPGGDLGLEPPMAQKIISLYGGSVAVRNDDPAGVSFVVTLKRPEMSAASDIMRDAGMPDQRRNLPTSWQ